MHPGDAGDLAIGTAAPTRRHGGRLGDLWRFLAATFIAERERWPLWIPVFVGTGIGIYFWLTVEPPLWLGLAALAVTLPAALVAVRVQRLAAPAIIAAAVALGFVAGELQTWNVAAPILERQLKSAAVEGRLVAVEPRPEGVRLIIEPAMIERLDPARLPALIRVSLKRDAAGFVPGEWLRFKAVLYPPPAPAMPGAYDFQRRAFFDQLGAVGAVHGSPEHIAAPPGAAPGRWRIAIEAVRTAVTTRIRAALPGESGAIAAALITGQTHAIPPADAGAFRDAGLAHILLFATINPPRAREACTEGLDWRTSSSYLGTAREAPR
jgi:competence protein ComEC